MTGRLRCPDCDGPVQACAHLGRIPVWAICRTCRAEWLVTRLDDGTVALERHEPRRTPVGHGAG